MIKNIYYIIFSIIGIYSLTEASTGGMLRKPTTRVAQQGATHLAPWKFTPIPTASHVAGAYTAPKTITTSDMWRTAIPQADALHQYKMPTTTETTLLPAQQVSPTPTTTTSNQTALNQLEAWKNEFSKLKSIEEFNHKYSQIKSAATALKAPPGAKEKFVEFLKEKRKSLKDYPAPTQTKQKQSPSEKEVTSTPSKPSTPPIPKPSNQPSSKPLENLQQSMFRKVFEWGLGKLGLGTLGKAKKQAENIAFSAQNPEQLFRVMHGLNSSQQEEVLNSWVEGWKANLNRHKQHPARYEAELEKFQTQLKATLAHMHKILPPSQITLLTSDNYSTDSLDHHSVKMNVLDSKEGNDVSQKVIHSQNGINVHHRETPWAEYMFSLAVEYVKNEITTYLKGQTKQTTTTNQPVSTNLDENEPAY